MLEIPGGFMLPQPSLVLNELNKLLAAVLPARCEKSVHNMLTVYQAQKFRKKMPKNLILIQSFGSLLVDRIYVALKVTRKQNDTRPTHCS